MTTRIFRASALSLTAAIGLIAGTLVLDPLGVFPSSIDQREPQTSSVQRTALSPMIIVGTSIDVEPASHAPLLIDIGPPEWVPRDSTLYLEGLPDAVALSLGHRVSANLWAVSIGDLPKLHIDVAAGTAGRSDVTIRLDASDGSLLAKARTAISIIAPSTAAATFEADGIASSTSLEQRTQLPSRSATSQFLPAAAPTATAMSADAELSEPAPVINEEPKGPKVGLATVQVAVGTREVPHAAPPNVEAERDSSPIDTPKTTSLAERNVANDRDALHRGRDDGEAPQRVDQVSLASSEDARRMLEARRVEEILALAATRVTNGDVVGARAMLAAAEEGAQGPVTFALAETYDPNVLAAWGTRGISADVVKAKWLYRKALELGITRAHKRLKGLE